MRVVGLWRFPVKSMGGESLERAEVGELGITGDRQWGVLAVETGKVLTARREPKLLFVSARLVDDDVAIELPDGHTDLSEWLGYEVRLVSAADGERGLFENPRDIETEAEDSWHTWTGPEGVFHDSKRRRISLLSTQTIGDWNLRRFRANVIVDGGGEDEFVGGRIRIGSVEIDAVVPIDRCVMTTRPQPGIERDLDVLRTINKERAGYLSVGGVIARPGTITLGDEVKQPLVG